MSTSVLPLSTSRQQQSLPWGCLFGCRPRSSHQNAAEADEEDLRATEIKRQEELMLYLHKVMVDRIQEEKEITVIPFAKACQERWNALGGWPKDVIDLSEAPLR